MAGLQVLPCILVCAAAALVANGTLTELDLALLPQRPGLTTRGTEFIFAFMGNDKVESPLHKAATIVITTEEPHPVAVTVEVNPAFYVNNPNLDATTFPQTRMQTVEPGSSITFAFPVATIIPGNPPPGQDIRVYNINDRLDRNSGIRISTDGGEISVYGFNKELSSMDAFNIFPCYEYPAIVGNYEYVVLSTARQQTRDNRLMIVGCQNNTKVTITPPSQFNSIPTTVPASLGGGQTPRPSVPLSILDLDQLTSILLNNREDPSGTKITSDKPIAIFTGHECVTSNEPTLFIGTCDHIVQQVPPQVTWGRLFFTVPIVGRYCGDHYRVATTTANTQFTVTCRTLTNPTPTTRSFPIVFNDQTNTGFEVFNTTIGTTSGDRASRKDDLQWCCIESNNPVLVMQYAYGSSADMLLKDSGAATFGDPLMTIIPPVVQYLNNYTVSTEMGLRESQLDVGFTIAIPRDETFFRSPTEDGSRILLNDEAITPDPDEGWIEIFCANGQICGYSARVEHAPDGVITIRHVDPRAAVSAWVYGIAGAVSFGFTAGFKLDAVAFPIVRAENVTVMEMDGVAVVTFTRTGSLSLGSRFNVRLMSRSATSPADYDENYETNPTNATRTVINSTTKELVMKSNIATVTATFGITVDTIPENSEDFLLFLEGTRRVLILTPVVSVTILDHPARLEHEAYHVSEGDEYVEVCAILVRGIPTEPAKITLTTVDGGAAASKDYASISEDLVLKSVTTRSCVAIPILNDLVPEFSENFTVSLIIIDSHANIATEVATVTIRDDDVEPEPEKGCTVKVFVLTSMQEEQQKAVVNSVQSVFPSLFVTLPTDATTDKPTDSTTATTNGPTSTSTTPIFSTVRKDPLLSMTYTTLAEEFNKVESDAGYTQFVEAVTEITEAYQESCSGTKPRLNDVPRLAQQFAALSPTAAQELRNIFGKMLCIRQLYSAETSRSKRQPTVSPSCLPGEIFTENISLERFFECLDYDIEMRYGRLESVFGFTKDSSLPCLAFVVDTTGSMTVEIEAVQNLIQAFISSEEDEPACYTITPFNDVVGYDKRQPVHGEDYGPVKFYDTYTVGNLQEMLKYTNNLTASGGYGDCVEYGMHAIQQTLRAKLPGYSTDALERFSQIILITDAGAKDSELQENITVSAHRREVCIHLLLSTHGYCPDSFDSYLSVSSETGGTTVWADPEDIEHLIHLFGQFRSKNYQPDTNCESFYRNRTKRSNPERCQSFRVSVFTNILKFLIATQQSQSQATVRSPSGEVTEVSIFSGYGSQTIVHPEIGEWSICVESGTLSISFNNQVLLDYVVTFIEEDEQSPTHVVSTTNLPPGCSTGRVAVLTSRVSDISSAILNFISDENIIGSATLTPCSGAMVGNATFPLGSVTYQLQGEDMGGNPFTHNSRKTREFKPGNYMLTPSNANPQEIGPGESLVLSVQLHNQNVYGMTKYALFVESPTGFSAFLQQTSVSLQAGSSTQLRVHVSANSVLSGSIHRIILAARDECNIKVSVPLTLTVIALDFVVKVATEITCPGGETTTTNPPACSSGKVSVFTSQPIPGIVLTLLNFVRQGSVVASASLTHACGSAMVGNVIFPLGSVAYQLQGENQNGKNFRYGFTSTVEFIPGSYSLAANFTPGELTPGEPMMLTFVLYNQNQNAPATFTISSAAPSRFNVVLQETHVTLAAGSSTQIGVLVTAGSLLPGSTHQITLRATDGCTTVSVSQTLTIAAPPTVATNECRCTIHGTCIVVHRHGRRLLRCRCDSGYGGRLCDEEY